MTTTQNKALEKLVLSHFDVPENIRKLANQAAFDLHFGPTYEDGYPGFQEACEAISEWVDKADIRDLWINLDSEEVMTSEPDSGYIDEITGNWEEYFMENTYHLERRDVLRYLFNKELVRYID